MIDKYIGMKLDDAKKLAESRGFKVRIVVEGDGFLMTEDYNFGRLNLKVVDDVVVSVTAG